jgi:hypothetical protein
MKEAPEFTSMEEYYDWYYRTHGKDPFTAPNDPYKADIALLAWLYAEKNRQVNDALKIIHELLGGLTPS